jgi:SNARE associated Golgi protein
MASRRSVLWRIWVYAAVVATAFVVVAATGSLPSADEARDFGEGLMESRIVPALPYGLVNYSAGLTRLRYRDMTLGTVVGAAPKVFAYTALGGSLTNLASPEAIVAVAVLVVLALVGVLFVRRQIVAERGAASA